MMRYLLIVIVIVLVVDVVVTAIINNNNDMFRPAINHTISHWLSLLKCLGGLVLEDVSRPTKQLLP